MAIVIPISMIYGNANINLLKNNVISGTTIKQNIINSELTTKKYIKDIYNKRDYYQYDDYIKQENVNYETYVENNRTKVRAYVKHAIEAENIEYLIDNIYNLDVELTLNMATFYNFTGNEIRYSTSYSKRKMKVNIAIYEDEYDYSKNKDFSTNDEANLLIYLSQNNRLLNIVFIFNCYEQIVRQDLYYNSGYYILNFEVKINDVKELITNDSKEIKYGNEPYYQLTSNELFNDKLTSKKYDINSQKFVEYDYFEKMSNDLINKYSKGKITANLTCVYGNYYNTYGGLEINGNYGETLKVGDEVIPYKRKNGIEVPLLTKNNEAVKFKITSCEIVYEGQIKYNLELLEL